MQFTAHGNGFDELEERGPAGKGRDAEDRHAGRQVHLDVSGADVVEEPGQALGRARGADGRANEPPKMRLPVVVVRKLPAGAVYVPAGGPLQDEFRSPHRVAVEEVGEPPGPPEPGGTRGQRRERSQGVVQAPGTEDLEDRPHERVDVPRIGLAGVTGLEQNLAQASGEGEHDVRRHAVAPTGARGSEAPGELQGEPAAHRHCRHRQPLGHHRVGQRYRQHLSQCRGKGSHPAGTGQVKHERTLPRGCDPHRRPRGYLGAVRTAPVLKDA